jgi:hypothetical protein
LSGKDVAAAEEFDAHQLRLPSRYVHFAKMGFEEAHKDEDHRTSRFLQLFFSAAGFENDSQYARLFTSAAQSGESVGIGANQSCPGRTTAPEEGTKAPV